MTAASHADDGSESDDLDFNEQPPANPGYVGPQACAACHADRVAEFCKTNHYRTFRVPEPSAMPSGFAAGHGNFQTHDRKLRFEMTRSGDEFFQTAIRSDPGGDPEGAVRTKSRIDLILGAGGKADEVYLTWHDDRLFELPVAWLFTFDKWGCSQISPHGSGDFSRESTVRCLECHNTWFEHVPGTANQYKPDSFLMGVGCERCHGPGREHVAFHGAHSGDKSAHAIVRPARLSRERQLDLCTQCHSNAIKHKRPTLSYRPGEPLEDYYKTLNAPRNTEDDHVANQVKNLRLSKCFTNSDEMTCTTCHDPHRPEAPAASGLEACRKCHNDADCREQLRLPAAIRTNCVGCHMPHYVKINVNFETEDDNFVPPIRRCDHRIAVHPRARDEVLLEWYREQRDPQAREESDRLTKLLVDGWLAESETCRREFRFLGAIAAIREACRLDPAPALREQLCAAVAVDEEIESGYDDAVRSLDQRRYGEAIETLNRILRIKPDLAKAHGRLGTAYAATGKNEQAVEHLQLVARYDADDPYGYAMLGWLAYLHDDAEEAVQEFRRADAVEPYNAQINYQWGLALTKLERWDEAARHFRQVLAINPKHAGGWQGLAHVLRKSGQPQEALRYAQRAARLSRFENADLLLTLTDVYADLGRFAEAAAAAKQALDAAQAHAPQLAPQIQQWLDELQARTRPRSKEK